MIIVISLVAGILTVSALLVLYRIVAGPTALDRMVGVDMMTSILIGAFSLLAALTRRSDLLAVFIVLGIVGFVGSTVVARFARLPKDYERRILTPAEAARLDQETIDDDATPIHDVDALEEAHEEAE